MLDGDVDRGGVALLWRRELIVKKCGATDRIVAIKVKTKVVLLFLLS
jgi:hypothetical protein